MEFLPEHWSMIKSYAGIYHIRTDWNLTKLDNNLIQIVLSWISPYKVNTNNMRFMCLEDRIKCIWQHLNKSKLKDVDSLIICYLEPKLCLSKNDFNQNNLIN
jgi:hypothetical protein